MYHCMYINHKSTWTVTVGHSPPLHTHCIHQRQCNDTTATIATTMTLTTTPQQSHDASNHYRSDSGSIRGSRARDVMSQPPSQACFFLTLLTFIFRPFRRHDDTSRQAWHPYTPQWVATLPPHHRHSTQWQWKGLEMHLCLELLVCFLLFFLFLIFFVLISTITSYIYGTTKLQTAESLWKWRWQQQGQQGLKTQWVVLLWL